MTRRQRREIREGAVLPWLLVCLGVILSIVALALDGGRMMQERRRCQDAADAAAIAAATDMYNTYATSSQTHASHSSSINAALAAAANFGYKNDGTNSIVTVNIPPVSGSFAGKADYVETIVQSNLKGSFGVTITGQKLVVKARAVAKGRPMAVGLFSLAPTGSGAIALSGNAAVTVNNAGVRVESSSSQAMTASGNAHATATWFSVVGSASLGSAVNHAVTTGADPVPDPLATLAEPDQTTATIQRTSALSYSANATHTLSPGIYRGGISLSGNTNTTMQPSTSSRGD
jgi:Putative Flp pilus-assembly TadE/G-like